ncbi:MAG TPA: hypothetical protein DCQ26_07870 [Marinilabiliales bacterium]|nr:MAG: hypothetical protein A2W95_01305 [Bacteroidetes bacterium GWA2_40_14]HAM98516.1 hypothetical protein [Marinilabiliales bacterium]HAZ02998.1 hypothetical protein [Marinilabiliales bacterium]HBO75949.1 hypothetical protein [Marinilabiliales bacterium]HBY53999.1 hypothetical protein [Marinilabiliales bacterium]
MGWGGGTPEAPPPTSKVTHRCFLLTLVNAQGHGFIKMEYSLSFLVNPVANLPGAVAFYVTPVSNL